MSEGTGFSKVKESYKCIICNYYYFVVVNFRFQLKVCNGCNDIMLKKL